MKEDESHICLNTKLYGARLIAFGWRRWMQWALKRGPKEIKSQTRTRVDKKSLRN